MGCDNLRANRTDEWYSSNIVLYDGPTLAACLGLAGGNTLNEVLDALGDAICAAGSHTTTLDSDNVTIATQIKPSCSLIISAGATLQSALEDIVDYLCATETTAQLAVPKTLYDAYSVLYADTDDTPAALTLAASTVVGRKSAGGVVALTMTELATEMGLFEREAANNLLRPITTGDRIGIGAENTNDKVLIVPLESATFAFNPTISWKHNIDGAGDGLEVKGMSATKMANKFYADNESNILIIASEGAGTATDSQRIRLQHNIGGGDVYWDILKDGGASNTFKLTSSGTTRLSLTTAGLLTLTNGVGIDGILDEDTMVSDSATKACTQQSIKAYVDTEELATRNGAGLQADGSLSPTGTHYVSGATDLDNADKLLDDELYERIDHLDDTQLIKTKRMCIGTFEIQAGVNDTDGTYNLHASQPLPDNAIITDSYYDVITTFVDDGTDATTISIDSEATGDVKGTIAISDGTNPWDAGIHDGESNGTASKMKKMTADRYLAVTITLGGASTVVSAGKMNIYTEYILSE